MFTALLATVYVLGATLTCDFYIRTTGVTREGSINASQLLTMPPPSSSRNASTSPFSANTPTLPPLASSPASRVLGSPSPSSASSSSPT
ncbi:hypothetical protein BJ165DRAFT_416312 [Panaeolus papilionaceus]|nr:hypothetical protein BJ165DRAFT_416312 [Panaeolus papilionaceus]